MCINWLFNRDEILRMSSVCFPSGSKIVHLNKAKLKSKCVCEWQKCILSYLKSNKVFISAEKLLFANMLWLLQLLNNLYPHYYQYLVVYQCSLYFIIRFTLSIKTLQQFCLIILWFFSPWLVCWWPILRLFYLNSGLCILAEKQKLCII